MRWSRRKLLGTTATGLVGVAAGCPSTKRGVVRAFVGQDPAVGHRLRDAAVAELPVAERIRCSVLIVGGGASGAAAAWRLARAAPPKIRESVHLVELEDALGGTARSGQTPRSPYPLGAHYLPTPHRGFTALRTLLDDLGWVARRDADGQPEYDPRRICRAPLERHRYRGRWEEGLYPGAGQTDDERDQWQRWRDHLRQLDRRTGADGRPLFTLPVDQSSTELRSLDQISMATYLDQLGLTSWRLRWAVDYACRDDYGCTLDHCSAFAALHHYLCRGLDDTSERFILTGPRGNDSLVSAMVDAAGIEPRTARGAMAYAIDPDRGTVDVLDLAARRRRVYEADAILWAAPRFILPRVLPAGRDPLPRGALTYSPWLVANVELSERPGGIGAPLCWDNVPVEGDNLGYVVATHLEPLSDRPEKGAVITFYQPLSAPDDIALAERRTELLAGSLDYWTAHVTAALEAMHPGITSKIRRIDVARWGHAMVRPIPGYLFGEGRATARASIGRVLPCAADVGGLPLFEEAFVGGVRAAEWALASLDAPVARSLL